MNGSVLRLSCGGCGALVARVSNRDRARAGDDPAFFELIGRDPRVVGSELTVAKVVSWRTELEGFAKYLNLKGSRLFPLTRLEEAHAKMEAAKKNLRRLGQVHIAFFDQRGKMTADEDDEN